MLIWAFMSRSTIRTLFGNLSSKRRQLVVEGGDTHFITCIAGTVTREDCFEMVNIKCCTLNYRLHSLNAIHWFYATCTEKHSYRSNGNTDWVFPRWDTCPTIIGVIVFYFYFTHLSILFWASNTVSSGSWFLGLLLGSVCDFSNTGDKGLTSVTSKHLYVDIFYFWIFI